MIPTIFKDLNDPAWHRHFTDFKYSAWRLETLQTYDVGYERKALTDFLDTGRTTKIAKAMDPWIDDVVTPAVTDGRYIGRVHVVEVDPASPGGHEGVSDYMRYESAAYRFSTAAGEDVRIIETTPGKWPEDVYFPGNDFWLFDSEILAEMHYNNDGTFRQAVVYNEVTYPAALARAAKCREVAQMRSVPFSEWMDRKNGATAPNPTLTSKRSLRRWNASCLAWPRPRRAVPMLPTPKEKTMLTLFDNELPNQVMTRYTTARDRVNASLNDGQVYQGQYARIVEASLIEAAEPGQATNDSPLLGTRAIKRLRVTYDSSDNRPYSVSLSWFPTQIQGVEAPLDELCPALLECERIRQGTPAYLREHAGITIDNGYDRVAIASASDAEARLLGVSVGSPVKRTFSLLFSGEHMVEYAESSTASTAWTEYRWDDERV